MRTLKYLLGVSLCAIATPAFAQQPAQAAETGAIPATEIIVTARRTEEKLQDVPVAVSVVTPGVIEARGAFSPVDLVQSAPGLSVTASVSDRNNLTYTIRGQGYSFGTLFPAVITYFNEVPITRLTQGQFFDLANVQVLRGPQGVNFGRVTDGGNVMLSAQTPKGEFGGYIGAKLGNYGLHTINGAINVPLVADKVLLRAAFETARRDGFTTNDFNGRKLDNVAYEGYRFGLTLRPVDRLENTTVVSIQRTHDNGTGVIAAGFNPAASGLLPNIGAFTLLMPNAYGLNAQGNVLPMAPGLTPLTGAAFSASMTRQLNQQRSLGVRHVNFDAPIYSKRKNLYIVNTTNVDLTESIQIRNVFGYTREQEDQASLFAPFNGGAINTCHSACPGADLLFTNAEQFSEELRLSGQAIDNRLVWSLGGYMDEQRPHGLAENATINVALLNRVTSQKLTTKSRAAYGSAEFAITDNLKINGGLRYTHDTMHTEQNTYTSFISGGEAALLQTLLAPTPTQAFVLGRFGYVAPMTPAAAQAVVNASFAPIPHGTCVTFGVGSLPNGPAGSPCKVRDGSFNAFTYQAGISYKTDGGQMFYAKISRGYRPGGVNTSAPAGVDPAYDPEYDLSIEGGVKADWRLGGMFLRTNVAAYTDRYTKIQKNVVLPGPVPVSSVRNVDDARISGVEAEATLIPVEGLTLGGTLAYTHARFDALVRDPTGDPCDPTKSTTIGFCSDNRFNAVPDWQWTLNFNYETPLPGDMGKVSFGGRAYHQSLVALTDTSMLNPDAKEPGYTTLDLNAGWKNFMGQPIDLAVFVTNVTDKVYRIGTNNLLQNASVGVAGDIYAPPRMWGASVKLRFGGDAQ